jgi:hypothetical protein
MDIKDAVARAIDECGFLNYDVVQAFATNHEYTNQDLLIVAHNGRVVCPAYMVPRMVASMQGRGDHIRSVQIPTGHSLSHKLFPKEGRKLKIIREEK